MEHEMVTETPDENPALLTWSARKLHPVVLAYAAAVFAAMILLAYFVLHSGAAVSALALGAVGFIIPLVPTVLSRVEYRLTGGELEKRMLRPKGPGPITKVFSAEELSHIVVLRRGFKFYLPVDEAGAVRRFWKSHISDEYSGEVHVEREDRDRVLGALSELGVQRR